jgi:maleate isomerase
MNTEGVRCAAELADARVDVMSTACLVAIMSSGPGYHREAERELAAAAREAGADSVVMTSAGALIDGLKALGARRIALLAPYMRNLARKVVDYIEGEGITVQDYKCFEIPDNLAVGARNPMQLLDDVKSLNVSGVDVVVLSACVQMQSLPALELAQQQLGIPVTSTAVCTAWKMLRSLKLDAVAPGGGALLDGRAR